MSKVLISFLGTGPLDGKNNTNRREYKKAKYVFEDGTEKTTSFVTAAIKEYRLCDKVIVLGTAKSMWEEYFRYFAEKNDCFNEELYFKLAEFAESASHTTTEFPLAAEIEKYLPDTKIIILRYGLNEYELRHNLEQILKIEDYLQNEDEVFVDVTHGFRSFPLFAQQIILYLKQVSNKKINLRNFFYGMLDASRDLGYAPIVDLSIIQTMNDWILGSGLLINKSDGSLLVSLLKESDPQLATLVDNFSKALNINYSHEIRQQYQQILKADFSRLKLLEKAIALKAFNEFKQHFKNVEMKKHSLFQLDLAAWYFNKKLYGVAYLTLTEALVTYTAEKINPDNPLDQATRDEAKKQIRKINSEVGSLYHQINKIRKNVAHMLEERHHSFLNDITNLEQKIKKAYRLLND